MEIDWNVLFEKVDFLKLINREKELIKFFVKFLEVLESVGRDVKFYFVLVYFNELVLFFNRFYMDYLVFKVEEGIREECLFFVLVVK